MNAMLKLIGRRARFQPKGGRIFSLLVVLALLLQIGLPGTSGVQVVQAAGPGGPSGSFTHTTAADFNTASCATLTNTTVTNYNADGEVRLLASLEDYFNGTEVNASLWNSGPVNPIDYPEYLPIVAGGVVTHNGSYMQSTQLFTQSPRFMEARVLMRSTVENATYEDVGFYRAIPPAPPSTESPITADTAVRLFLVVDGGSNNFVTRLADGTEAYADDDSFTDPDLTTWHNLRINWGAVDTDYIVDGTLLTTMTEQLAGGDTLGARLLLYHQEPYPDFPTSPMQVDWIRGGQYPASGTYDSCVYDATGVVNFRNASWLADVPTGSGLTIQTRTSLDNVTWSAWSTPINAGGASPANLNSPSGRYFQYRLNFTSSSLIDSAELRQMQVNYFGPTTIDVTPASPTVNPGTTQQFTAAVSDGVNPITGVTVNWSVTGSPGNGTINSSGLYTAPLTPGTYTNVVNATVNLVPSGTLSDTSTVTVPNTPPLADAGGPYTGPEGSIINLLGTGSDPNGGAVTFAWDLDNNGSYEINTQNTTFTRNDNGGPFTVVLRVTDPFPSSTTDTTTVTVTNVAPTATFNAPTSVNEGSPVNLSLTSPVDPSTADVTAGFTYSFNCGSGFGSYSATNNVSCPTTDNGTLAVGGRIRDKDNGVTEYTTNVTVANVAPSATFTAPTTVNEGSPIEISLTSPSDPSSADTTAGFEYAFDCGTGFGDYGSATSTSCPTNNNGEPTVGARIRDKNLGVRTYTQLVTIVNVAPTADSLSVAPATVNEGTDFGLTLVPPYNDPSSVDRGFGYTFAFDCGTGTFSPEGPLNNLTCQAPDDGTLTVRGRIKDFDGGFTIYSGSITVNNIAPQITSVTNDGPVLVGVAAQITVTATGFAGDVLTYEFDCNNDGTFEVGPQSSNVGTCTFSQGGMKTVSVRVNDDDGSSDTDTTVVNVTPGTAYFYLPLIIKTP